MLFRIIIHLIENLSAKYALLIAIGVIAIFITNFLNVLPVNKPSIVDLLINFILVGMTIISFIIFTGIILIQAELKEKKRSNIN